MPKKKKSGGSRAKTKKASRKPAAARARSAGPIQRTGNKKLRAAPAMMPAAASGGFVHACIVGCAGNDNFGPNTQLRNIPADPQCVQACVTEQSGKPVIVTGSDTENSIKGKL